MMSMGFKKSVLALAVICLVNFTSGETSNEDQAAAEPMVTPSSTPLAATSVENTTCSTVEEQWCGQFRMLQKQPKKYHVYIGRRVTFFEAWRLCRNSGLRLASISSPKEQAMIEAAIRSKTDSFGPFYIGGTDLGFEGQWIWVDSNRPIGFGNDYFNFLEGEPNNEYGSENCLNIGHRQTFVWNDVPCTGRYDYVCESGVDNGYLEE